MHVKDINDEISKRLFYGGYNNGGNGCWYSHKWLLWLLLLIPLLIVIVLFCVRKRKNSRKAHVVDNNQYYQTQQAGGYYNGQGQGYPNNQYDNQFPPPNSDANQYQMNSGYGGFNQQQGYTGATAENFNTDEFQRPEGPPPAHYKS